MKIDVMGTKYTVYTNVPKDDKRLEDSDGYIMPEFKYIVLDKNNVPKHQEHVLRHELVHAFLHESGLDVESWATNEEIVDWIALQTFKMNKTIKSSLKELNSLTGNPHNKK